MAQSGEDDLIERFFAPLAGEGGLGLKDDAARLSCEPGHELVITCDALVAGVHFFAEDPAAGVAAKALRVNLSDLAAKGARPKGFILALALSADCNTDWLAAFSTGLAADITQFGCALLGGDTVKTPGPAMISITAFGLVPKGRMVPRSGAQAGDLLFVSGTIGDAALGLQLRLGRLAASADTEHLAARYLCPQPRCGLAPALLDYASGAMDVSDGLIGDLSKMMRVSGVSAQIDLAAIPFSQAATSVMAAQASWRHVALTGGDDYEILASVPPAHVSAFEHSARQAGLAVTCIGRVVAGTEAPVFLEPDGTATIFAQGSYSHF